MAWPRLPFLRMFHAGRELALQQPEPPAIARQEPRLMRTRRFEAARIDRTNLDFRFDHNSIDTDLRHGLRTLRGRMRYLEQNNDYAKGWLKIVRRNVIGPNGIRLINAATNPDRSLDENANEQIEEGWEKWSRKGTCTADGKQSLLEAAWTWITSVARDGEGLIRLLPGFDNPFGFALQFLEADYLDEHLFRDLPDGGRIRMGVEMDRYDRPTAYWLFTRHPGDFGWNPGAARVRVPADQILHGFVTERFGQTRGLPWGHAAMRRLHMLGKYEEYALIAARVGAAKGGFFEQKDPAAGDPWTQTAGEEKTEEGDMVRDVTPGEFEALPPGWTVKEWNPDYPRGELPAFNRHMLRAVATGLGAAYEGIGNDRENVNYSSIRAGLLDERDEWRLLQAWTAIHFHQPIYDAWLPMAMLKGAISLPFSKLEKFAKPIWRGRGWAWVDPAKEIDAYTRAVALGVMSRTQIAALEGRDIEDTFRELVSEKSLAQKLGLILLDPIPAGRPSAPPTAEDDPAPANAPDETGASGGDGETAN